MRTVGEVMSTRLVCVEPTVSVTEAAAAMSSGRAGSALVLEGDALVGVFTERDILRAMAEHSTADAARVSFVFQWMTRDPVTIEPGATVGQALDLMLEGGFRHLPVMEGAAVVGVVSMRDLAQALSRR